MPLAFVTSSNVTRSDAAAGACVCAAAFADDGEATAVVAEAGERAGVVGAGVCCARREAAGAQRRKRERRQSVVRRTLPLVRRTTFSWSPFDFSTSKLALPEPALFGACLRLQGFDLYFKASARGRRRRAARSGWALRAACRASAAASAAPR